MRQMDYLKMNTALWKSMGTEYHYNLSGWLDAAVNLENSLRELDGELSEFGGIGFVSQDEHTDKIIEILTVLKDCREYLDKDIEDYVDRPLKETFNTLDDQLASIDARKIKTPNLAGDKIAVGRDEYGEPCSYAQIAPQMLTLEDFTGNSIGETQGYLIYNQKIEGFADIMEERYNYTATDAESEISYNDYTQWYEPSESYFKKDVSFWTRAAQTAWSATGIGDFVDAALGYELITGDMNTLEESRGKAVEGMFETALLCLPGVMNAGGGGKAVLCAVGKEFGENMVTDTMYEAMEAGGCSEARSILNAVLIFRTVYSFVDAANSAVNANRFRDTYKDKDWTDWVKRTEGTGKNSDVPKYPKGVVQGKSSTVVKGTLNGKLDGLTADERGMVEDLLSSGKNVEIIPRSNTSKTPDFFVDGVKTELKTLNGSSLNTPVTRIEDGFEQGAEIVIIDGRKTGLTLEQANIVIERALGKYNGEMPGIVEIWTNEGIIRR